jgi:hypothetical protein
MPVKYIPIKKSYQWGNSGHPYPVKQFGDKGAKERAEKQGIAILYSEGKIKEAKQEQEKIIVKGNKNQRSYSRNK